VGGGGWTQKCGQELGPGIWGKGGTWKLKFFRWFKKQNKQFLEEKKCRMPLSASCLLYIRDDKEENCF
jgi:hypothetical protein